MKIVLKTLDNIHIPFQVEPSDTFGSFEEQIYHAIGVPPDFQKLVFAGQVCFSSDTFSDRNIQDGSQIYLAHRMKMYLTPSTYISKKIRHDSFLRSEDSDHMIIWLDRKIDEQQFYNNLKNAFSFISELKSKNQPEQTPKRSKKALYTNYTLSMTVATVTCVLEVFSSITDCLNCFDQNKNKCIFFITSNAMARLAVPLILDNFREIFTDLLTYGFHLSIYVFRENDGEQLDWAFDYRNNIQVFDFDEDLFVRLIRDIADYHVAVGRHILKSSPSHIAAVHRRLSWSEKLYGRYCDIENVSLKKEFDEINVLLGK
ncbi:hypothetical protein I4U23_022015 [Adineta vaga]|nr:hypothetical protein I4U23_022015 [Adineta vaga]